MLQSSVTTKKTNKKSPRKKTASKSKVGMETDRTKTGPVEKEVKQKSVPKIDLIIGSNRFQVLAYEQVLQLHSVIGRELLIKPYNDSFLPPIKVNLKYLLGEIRGQLKEIGIVVKDIRLNMDVATSVMSSDKNIDFKVIDVIFSVSLPDATTQHLIKNVVFKTLLRMLRTNLSKEEVMVSYTDIDEDVFKNHYIRSMARVNNVQDLVGDAWSLISVGMQDCDGQTVELKFIDRLKRQYEFTVDSFQIILDTLLSFRKVSKGSALTPNLFPTVVVECVSGSIVEALMHLKEKRIFTRQPEEICGGGLLKYCKMLVDGYKQDQTMDVKAVEKYMCSRFFIDYPEIGCQKQKVEIFLNIYFHKNFEKQLNYLKTLHKVVAQSTVCLMIHERRESLKLLKDILKNTSLNIKLKKTSVHFDHFNGRNWNLDQIFYGTTYFPQQVYVVDANQSEDVANTNLVDMAENQIYICTGDSSLPMDSIPENQETIAV